MKIDKYRKIGNIDFVYIVHAVTIHLNVQHIKNKRWACIKDKVLSLFFVIFFATQIRIQTVIQIGVQMV